MKFLEEYISLLRQIFEIIRTANLRLQHPKCEFAQKKLSFLSMVFEKDALFIDLQKLEIVKKFPRPNNQKSLKGFLGMTTFLPKFIRNYSHIAVPLNTLLKRIPSISGQIFTRKVLTL